MDWGSSFFTVIFLVLSMVEKVQDIYYQAVKNMQVQFKNAYCGSLGGTTGAQNDGESTSETAKVKHAIFCKIFLGLLRKKALWFLQKIFDIPV